MASSSGKCDLRYDGPMAQTVRKTLSTHHPRLWVQITDDGSRTLIDPKTQVAFHSASGALSETRHVYFRNSGIADRLAQGEPTSVLEIGLGTGMGMLVTLDAARSADAVVDYTAVDSEWISARLIRQLRPWEWTTDRTVVERFLQWRESLPNPVPAGLYRWKCNQKQCVSVHVGNAETWQPEAGKKYDAIYFDPFAPDVCGKLWQPIVLATMHEILRPDGRLVTYCVSRKIRAVLSDVGFDIRTVPGPLKGKREVLIATKSL